MADILIRGMNMPAVCIDNGWYGNCPMDRAWCANRFAPKDSTNESAQKDQWNKLPSWCPLVPLPEGHGRLGDLDRLFEAVGQDADRWIADEVSMIETDDVLDAIQTATTIIPAEGGGNDGA